MRAFTPKLKALTRQLGYLGIGNRRILGNGASTGNAATVPSFLFDPRGTGSIVPVRGSATITTSRASTATAADFEGKLYTALTNETRMVGQRRVRNLLTFTEAISNAAWDKLIGGTGVAPTITDNFAGAPDGTATATRIQATIASGTGAGDFVIIRQLPTAPSAAQASVWIKSNSGSSVNVRLFDVNQFTITSQWQRFSALNGAARIFQIQGSIATDKTVDVLVWHPQYEDVIGQSNQNPAEYVSVGVLSAPFHGANVDGVRYFPWLNGNTVSSNVVTEAQGALIPLTTNRGYLPEAAATNLALQSTFAATWVTTRATLTPNAVASPDGSTNAATLIEDGTAANTHITQQTFTKAASAITYTASVFVRPVGRTWAAIQLQDGVNSATAYFNCSGAGTVGVLQSNGTWVVPTGKITALANGWYRISMTTTSSTSTTLIWIQYLANADNSVTYNGDSTSGQQIYGADLKAGDLSGVANTYIPTTTVAVTRAADSLTYSTTGWLNANSGTLYAEWFNSSASAGTAIAFLSNGTNSNYIGVFRGPATTAYVEIVSGGAPQGTLSAISITANATAKAVIAYATNDFVGYANNTLLGTDGAATIPAITTLTIGDINGSGFIPGNPIAKVAYFPNRLPNATTQGLTA